MRIVLDLPKNCKDDRDLVYSQPVSPVISILHYYRAFITSNIDSLFTGKKSILYSGFIQASHYIYSSHILRPYLVVAISHAFCFWWYWQCEERVKDSVEYPLTGICLLFLMIELGWSVLKRRPRRWSTAPVSPYGGHLLSTGLVTVGVNLDQLPEVLFANLLHHEVPLFSFLSILNSLEGGHCAQPHLRMYVPPPWRLK